MFIRPAKVEDLENMITMYQDTFNQEGDHWSKEIVSRRLHQALTMDDSLVLIVVDDQGVYGLLTAFYEWFYDGPILHISEILVATALRNQGWGTKLMDKAEQCAKEFGASALTLDAINDPMHNYFYGKYGFQVKENLVFHVKKLR